jgi:pseudaminic acid biosynthesis-associated methylase
MRSQRDPENEARRLEALWRGSFGDDYVDRNRNVGHARQAYWHEVMADLQPRRVLEIGCNLGANLRWIASHIPPHDVYGIDINKKALDELRKDVPGIQAVLSQARQLPFLDGSFDLVFTMGVLIHQAPQMLPDVMREIVRCSRRFILGGEYYSPEPIEVTYRGRSGALFKRDFGSLYQELFPELVLRSRGFLSREAGWDDVTFWVLEKPDR